MASVDALRGALLKAGSVTFDVKVLPRAAVSGIVGELESGELKIKLAAVPDKGKANDALRVLLADTFAVPRSHVEIVSGQTSRHKRVRVSR